MIYRIDESVPDTDLALFIADNAVVAGRVMLGANSSIWFSAVLRGDVESITIGEGTNIQDASVVHVDTGFPALIGEGVTVGHGAIIHGCTIGHNVIVGMGSTVLNGATIGEESIVGAGALVPPGKTFEPRSLLIGAPARAVRLITDEELAGIRANAKHYIENARKLASDLQQLK